MSIDWKELSARVRRNLKRHGVHDQDLDDLIHEAWLRMNSYQQRHAVKEPVAFMTTVAIHLAIDEHRARERHGEEALPEGEADIADSSPNVEDVVIGWQQATLCDDCTRRLDRRTRQVFLASRLEGKTYEQIARRHGISVSSVEKLVAKALVLLTRCMQERQP